MDIDRMMALLDKVQSNSEEVLRLMKLLDARIEAVETEVELMRREKV